MGRRFGLIVVLLACFACSKESRKSAFGESCTTTTDCESGLRCIGLTCVSGEQDAKQAWGAFLDQMAAAYCPWQSKCASVPDTKCRAALDKNSEYYKQLLDCASKATYYVQNRAAIDACLTATPPACGGGDDPKHFCAALGGLGSWESCAPGPTSDGGVPTTGAGKACGSDSECPSGMRCLNSGVPGSTRYCAPTCSTNADCQVMHDATYGIKLEPKLASDNHWNMPVLWRVITCDDPGNWPAVGSSDGKSYCIYVCPDKSSGKLDKPGGEVTACSCLPNYIDRKLSNGGIECNWNPAVQCSIFNYCTKTNTQQSQCSQGHFTCVVGRNLEGRCLDMVSGSEIEACIAKCSWNCDASCLANTCTGNNAETCTTACCQSSDPACN